VNNKRPTPLLLMQSSTARRTCPVCGNPSYSRAGIHPQCAQLQADIPRMARVRAAGAAAKAAPTGPEPLNSWQKRCPRCKAALHIRKQTCDCGYEFPTRRA
jgi:hypothetical protein